MGFPQSSLLPLLLLTAARMMLLIYIHQVTTIKSWWWRTSGVKDHTQPHGHLDADRHRHRIRTLLIPELSDGIFEACQSHAFMGTAERNIRVCLPVQALGPPLSFIPGLAVLTFFHKAKAWRIWDLNYLSVKIIKGR